MNKIKNVIAELFLRSNTKRNIESYKNKIRRIKVYVLLMIVFASPLLNTVCAIENSNVEYGDYNIYWYNDPNIYVYYNSNPQPNYEYYYNKNGIDMPAYCLNLGKKGAEDLNGYIVNAKTQIQDDTLKSIVLNCYPYVSKEELGLNRDQAMFASQFAIWIYTEGLEINSITANGEENQCVVDAIVRIYNNGIQNVNTYNIDIEKSISNQRYELIDNIGYYLKDIEFSNLTNIKELNIKTEDKNVKIIKEKNKYSVAVPVSNVKKDYSLDLDIEIIAKENATLFGVSSIDGFQDMAVTLNDTFNTSIKEKLDYYNTEREIIIEKRDIDTQEPLEGVEYSIKDEYNNEIGIFKTDKNGEIRIKIYDENISKLYAKELKTLEKYIIDNDIHELDIKNNSNFKLYNEKKKGKIKIMKRTKEYNPLTDIEENMPLSNVSFYIYDSNMNIVDNITTDKHGCAVSKELPLGKYYIEEYKTNDGYKLLDKRIEVEIKEESQTVNIQILNENVDVPNELPKTGR